MIIFLIFILSIEPRRRDREDQQGLKQKGKGKFKGSGKDATNSKRSKLK